jgi:hypothetical protein
MFLRKYRGHSELLGDATQKTSVVTAKSHIRSTGRSLALSDLHGDRASEACHKAALRHQRCQLHVHTSVQVATQAERSLF